MNEEPKCNCGSTYGYYKDGVEQVIHFEDCALIEKAGLILW